MAFLQRRLAGVGQDIVGRIESLIYSIARWEFPNIGGTLFWCPYDKGPTIQGTMLGSPIFGNSQMLQMVIVVTLQSRGRRRVSHCLLAVCGIC